MKAQSRPRLSIGRGVSAGLLRVGAAWKAKGDALLAEKN